MEVVEISLSYIVLIATILSQKSYRRKYLVTAIYKIISVCFELLLFIFPKLSKVIFQQTYMQPAILGLLITRQLQSAKCTKDVQKNDID